MVKESSILEGPDPIFKNKNPEPNIRPKYPPPLTIHISYRLIQLQQIWQWLYEMPFTFDSFPPPLWASFPFKIEKKFGRWIINKSFKHVKWSGGKV